MSSKITLAEYSAQTDERLTLIENGIAALLEAATEGKRKPAKATAKKATSAKASTKAKGTRKASTKASADVRTLTKRTRAEFVAEHEWAKGLSTAAISALLQSGEQEAPGWRVSTFRQAKAEGLTTSEFVAKRDGKGVTVAAKAGKKAKASNRKKGTKPSRAALESLTYSGLMAEAQRRNLKGRSAMNSAQLVAALS